MKKIIISTLFILCFLLQTFNTFSQQGVSINNSGTASDNSALLDLSNSGQGMRIPRVALTDTALASPIINPVHSLLVFDTVTFSNGTPGYFFWDATYTQWVRLGIAVNSTFPAGSFTGDMQYWNGSSWVTVTIGTPGQYMMLNPSGIPTWTTVSTPTVTNYGVWSITGNSASCGGNVINDGGAMVTSRGICWSTSPFPTINDNKTVEGSGLGSFSCSISGLTIGTTYYLRSYATNIAGTGYGSESVFTTINLPSVTTSWATAQTQYTATCGGDVSSTGGETLTERGICWSTNSNPTISDSKLTDCWWCGTGTFTSAISGLYENTGYYVRAYATNSVGTAYGNEVYFSTPATYIPTLGTTAASPIGSYDATTGGEVYSDGGASVSGRGVCWNTTGNPQITDNVLSDCYWCWQGPGTFSSAITGLTPATTYYVRSYATNWVGTGYGNEISFRTLAILPTVNTASASSITPIAATCGGEVTSDGGETLYERGICWSTVSGPTISDSKLTDCWWCSTGIYSSSMTSLLGNTTYYVRAYATNSIGTAYGNEVSFVTPEPSTPILSTTAASFTGGTSATLGGNISSDGGSVVSERGVCWSLVAGPTTADSRTIDGSGTGAFTSSVQGLAFSTTYFVRAYATNSMGTAYGDELSITTNATIGVGDPYQGGIIGYVFQPADAGYISGEIHGLVVAASDLGGIEWGCQNQEITGADGSAIGTGPQNTLDIIAGCSTPGTAAEQCQNLLLNGYDDWYLPSLYEWNAFGTNHALIGGFSHNYYWTSTEYSGWAAEMTQIYWGGFMPGPGLYGNKAYPSMVRPVRTF